MYDVPSSEVAHLADTCNQKKKAAKIAGVRQTLTVVVTIICLNFM